MDTRDWVIVMVLGGVVALLGAIATDGNSPVTAWLGLGVAAVGFAGWQINARRPVKQDQTQATKEEVR